MSVCMCVKDTYMNTTSINSRPRAMQARARTCCACRIKRKTNVNYDSIALQPSLQTAFDDSTCPLVFLVIYEKKKKKKFIYGLYNFYFILFIINNIFIWHYILSHHYWSKLPCKLTKNYSKLINIFFLYKI